MDSVDFPSGQSAQFSYIFLRIFLWAASSNILVHIVAFLIAFYNLSAHKSARICAPIFILVMGVLNTMSFMLITSIVVAGVYKATGITFNEIHAVASGVAQTLLLFLFSVTRIPSTL
uniref:Transmembrane protein n=1 Tax=Schistosoma japonicum TaxID=6182 RepID=C1LHS7_SCHJA|nr:hypothetical protein [Schistosoma japonicum]